MEEESKTPAFSQLGLADSVVQAVERAGYEAPTEVQAEIIPHVNAGRDVLAMSQTGSGKTAAFALPILSRIDLDRRAPQVIVLAPTRELAIQVAESFARYGASMRGLQIATIYGGQDYAIQFGQLRRGAQVVVGTPGRIIDHMRRGSLDLSTISHVVLDEADEMLNMGFLEDVEHVLSAVPTPRQIALFSATMPRAIREVAERYLVDPVWVRVESDTLTATSIRQRAVIVPHHGRIDVLVRLLETEDTDGVIVFMRTKESTAVVADALAKEGIAAAALNGDMPQRARERTIDKLKSGVLDVIVATDVAARGLDVTRVSHVFNFDAPSDTESYVHRIGRTGRAGRAGEAILFLTRSQRTKLGGIERVTGQSIELMQTPTAADVNAKRVERFHARITETIASGELETFERLVEEYVETSGADPVKVAAAIASLAQRGRPFFADERGRREERPERGERRSREERPDRRRRDEDDRRERPRSSDRARPSQDRSAEGAESRTTASRGGGLAQLASSLRGASADRDERSPRAGRRDDFDAERRGRNDRRSDFDGSDRRGARGARTERGEHAARDSDRAPRARDDRAEPRWGRDNRDAPRGRDDRRTHDRGHRADERRDVPSTRERSADGMERYRLDVGHDDGVRTENIVGAVANEGGLEGAMIGAIRIHHDHSTIELPEGMSRDTYRKLRRTWVAGKPLGLVRTADDGRELPPCHQVVDDPMSEEVRAPKRDRRRGAARSGGWEPPKRTPRQFGRR